MIKRFFATVPVLAFVGLCVCLSSCEPSKDGLNGNSKAVQSLSKDQAAAASQAIQESQTSKPKSNKPKDKVALLLNWYPEAEHGGFYAAQVHGIYDEYGLDVEIRPGGKTTVVAQELTLGRIQFGIANADDVLIARNQDVDMVALMAPIQNGPRCIMVRKDSGITSFAELKNLKLQIDSSRPYVPFLKSKGYLTEGVEIVPYFGSVAQLVAEPRIATQGYSFSEPFMAKQQGAEVVELMMSDIGYNPYASLLVATDSYVNQHEDICKRMVQASIQGWKKYLEAPSKTNEVILAQNKQGLEKEALEYGVVALKPLCIPEGTSEASMGTMAADRWTTLANTLNDLKMIDGKKVAVDKAYTLKFVTEPTKP